MVGVIPEPPSPNLARSVGSNNALNHLDNQQPSRTAAGVSGTAKPWGPGRARAKHPHGATFPRAHGVQATHPAAAPGAAPARGALAGRARRSAIPVRLRPSLFAGDAGGATGAPSVLRRVTVGGGFTPARRQGSRLGLARGGEDGNPRALAGRKSDWCPQRIYSERVVTFLRYLGTALRYRIQLY